MASEPQVHGPDEPLPAGLDWTADDEAAYLDREAAGFPVEHYEDPSFTPVAASQFVSGYEAAKSAIEADR